MTRALTPERIAQEETEARCYAALIILGFIQDWHEVNQRIIDRWSLTALRRVKKRAWQIADDRP